MIALFLIIYLKHLITVQIDKIGKKHHGKPIGVIPFYFHAGNLMRQKDHYNVSEVAAFMEKNYPNNAFELTLAERLPLIYNITNDNQVSKNQFFLAGAKFRL